MKQNQKSAAIGFIFITLLIDITGWGIIIPVVPKLIEELIHADISEAAKYGGWLSFAIFHTVYILTIGRKSK
jgi:DHA1 family tetracycline resistance protein-like MFS transporter